jgi:hypothetical protein
MQGRIWTEHINSWSVYKAMYNTELAIHALGGLTMHKLLQ